jgi:hypothetical protein
MDLNNKEAAQIANFVQFTYNRFSAGVLTPPADPGIASAGFDLLCYLNGSDFDAVKFYGFIAVSKTNPGEFVLAVRGIENPAEWLLDFIALPVPFTPAPDAGFVALGFLSIFDSFRFIDKTGASMTLSRAVTQMAASAPIQKLTVVGHSLGGALATLAAAELAINNVAGSQTVLTSYTFGSPRVGLLDLPPRLIRPLRPLFESGIRCISCPRYPRFHSSTWPDSVTASYRPSSRCPRWSSHLHASII